MIKTNGYTTTHIVVIPDHWLPFIAVAFLVVLGFAIYMFRRKKKPN